MQPANVKCSLCYSIDEGPHLFKTIEYEVPTFEQSLIYLFANEAWRELSADNLQVHGITFSFRAPMSTDAPLTDS